MGLSRDELRRARLSKEGSSKNKALVSRNEGEIELQRKKLESLKIRASEDIDSKIKALQVAAIDTAAQEIAERKNEKNEVLFIFDKSGSCSGLEEITISGFMDVINKENMGGYNDVITTVLFSGDDSKIHDRLPIDQVRPFRYTACGNTALYDSVFKSICYVRDMQKFDKVPVQKTLVVIMTDGEDNSSHTYDVLNVRRLITERIKAGWEFIFLGTNIDVKYEAKLLGIKPENAVRYCIDGISQNFEAIERALEDIHEAGEVKDDWAKPITDKNHLLESGGKKLIKKLGKGNRNV